MKRKEYWKHIADSKFTIKKYKSKETRHQIEDVIFRIIEKSVASIALKNNSRANQLLLRADSLMTDKDNFSSDSTFYLYKLLLLKLLQRPIEITYKLLVKSKLQDTLKELMRFEIKDIIDLFSKAVSLSQDHTKLDIKNYSTEGFKDTSIDFYYYQALANHQFDLARFYYLAGKHYDSFTYLKEARSNYRSAMDKIHETLARENHHWEKFKELPDVTILQRFPDDAVYVEKRNQFKGNIPLFQRQIQILSGINIKTLKRKKPEPDEKLQVEENVRTIFGSKDGVSSNLTLIDELIWIFILMDFNGKIDKNRSRVDLFEFIRRFLI